MNILLDIPLPSVPKQTQPGEVPIGKGVCSWKGELEKENIMEKTTPLKSLHLAEWIAGKGCKGRETGNSWESSRFNCERRFDSSNTFEASLTLWTELLPDTLVWNRAGAVERGLAVAAEYVVQAAISLRSGSRTARISNTTTTTTTYIFKQFSLYYASLSNNMSFNF